MLIIRKEQIDFLMAPKTHQLVHNLMDHAKQHFPEECAPKEDPDLYNQIADTVKRAKKYNIKNENDLYKYVNITMLYGPDFDEQEATQWTAEYLTDESVSSPCQRLNRLYEEIIYRLEVEENNAAIEKEFYGDGEEEEDWDDEAIDKFVTPTELQMTRSR